MEEISEVIIENNSAQDWLYEFSVFPGLNLVEMSLYIVSQETKFININLAQEALVACEVVARLNGQYCFKNKSTEIIDQWVEETEVFVTDRLKNKAYYAIDKILTNQSELRNLYKDDDRWLNAVSNLKKRVKAE